MMKVCVLGSGSRGNAVFVAAGGTRLLVDAGFSTRGMAERLAQIHETLERVDAIFISHEHVDHVQALPVLTRKVSVPVFMTRACALLAQGGREIRGVEYFAAGETVELNGLRVRSFSVPHDAADPVGFVIDDGTSAVGVVLDLGTVTGLVRERLRTLSALIVESNHDPEMLLHGPYSWELKQRIQGRLGHLANRDGAALAAAVAHPGLKHVFLAHLSETNNTPQLALAEAQRALDHGNIKIHVVSQARPSEVITLRG